MPATPKIRLLVADDQEMVRHGVKALLGGTEIKIMAEAASGQAAVKLAQEKDFDSGAAGRLHARWRWAGCPEPHQGRQT